MRREVVVLSGIMMMMLSSVVFADATSMGKSVDPVPVVDLSGKWVLKSEYSDEFDDDCLDSEKWNNKPASWGTWSWAPENAYVKDGNLHIRINYEPHVRSKKNLFFKSGIIRMRQKVHYGYFEARIKACDMAPGLVCPAFWAADADRAQSTEIDFCELIETGNPKTIKTNTHIFRHPDLGIPSQGGIAGDEEKRKRELHEQYPVNVKWDPRNDFHVYSCEWNDQEIKWYIDGQCVRTRKNEYWHYPLDVMFSMGLRGKLRENVTNPSSDGFPTEFLCDYLRVWQGAEEK